MSTSSTRALPWIGFVGDLLRQPLTEMPHELIMDQLEETFEVTGSSFNWTTDDGGQGLLVHPIGLLDPVAAAFDSLPRGELLGQHPLMTWHLTLGDPRPSTSDRVPRSIVSNRDRQPLISLLRAIGCEQQLAINVRLRGTRCHAYVIARAGTDFTDEDLAVARQIQRALIGLDRQVSLYHRLTGADREIGHDAGLTPREVSVLALIAEGLPTHLIAHRLGCSPRTVHKHLEHAYRKLGVRDRVNAIRIAQQWNLTTSQGPLAGALLVHPRSRASS